MEKLPRQTLANIPKISTSNSLPFSTPFLSQNTCAPDPFPHSSEVSPKQTIRKSTSRTRRKGMASTSAVSMAVPLTHASQKRVVPSSGAFLKAPLLPLRPSSKAVAASKRNGRFQVRASMKEKVVTGLTAAALTASMMVPDVAEAAVSPSLKNFLLSIAAGGVVAVAIVGAVIGVANFDPVKRS